MTIPCLSLSVCIESLFSSVAVLLLVLYWLWWWFVREILFLQRKLRSGTKRKRSKAIRQKRRDTTATHNNTLRTAQNIYGTSTFTCTSLLLSLILRLLYSTLLYSTPLPTALISSKAKLICFVWHTTDEFGSKVKPYSLQQ